MFPSYKKKNTKGKITEILTNKSMLENVCRINLKRKKFRKVLVKLNMKKNEHVVQAQSNQRFDPADSSPIIKTYL